MMASEPPSGETEMEEINLFFLDDVDEDEEETGGKRKVGSLFEEE